MMDMGATTEMFLVLKAISLFFVIATTAVLGVGNSELAAAGNNIIGRGGRKLAEIPGFISIDCGSNEDYIDNRTGIPYVTDKGYTDTGVSETASSYLPAEYGRLFENLRSFPQGKRNCYSMRPDQGKNNKFLIRAIFLYGNYDGKNQVPEFDLYLGVNKWTTVNMDREYEIIHQISTNYIDVCLVNTGKGVPFISALELRRLDNSIYPITAGGALALHSRGDVGNTASGPAIRYPDDVYDRIWPAARYRQDWIPLSSSSTINTHTTDNAYEIPAQVLRTASKTPNASIPLQVYWTAEDTLSKYYVYLHFAEIEKLEPGHQREFTIALNGERILTESIKLDYLNPLTIVQDDPLISGGGGTLNFSIKAAQGTTIPPILNAGETYLFLELPNKSTAPDDVTAMLDIKTQYSVTRNWQGDPCVPSDYVWEGLNCNNGNPPRIISLNLSSSNLTGEIATSFSKLELIQSLDLSFNELTGPLLEVLEQLPNLKTLDLRGNKLTGSVPEALLEKSSHGKLDLRVDANPDLCPYTPCKGKKKKEFVIPVLAASITAVLVLLFIVGAIAIYRRKRGSDMVTKSSIKSKNRQYSYSEVVKITNNFKHIIGKGGFGNVYLGKLKDGIQVAVKLLSPSSNQGYKEFRAEAQLLMVVHHGNLVTLAGYCDDGENKALIYEYMANGNLQQHLSVTNPNVLTWNERLCIAVDAAHGLEYLHNGCKPAIIHRDLKPSNILLNEYMQAKIADFGLSRAFASESDSHVSTCPAGTLGYVDPEIQTSGNFNKKSDVYSFGIILFELITGRPAIIRGPMRNNHILDWVYPLIERADIQNVVDPRLEGEFNTTSAWKVVEIAMSCALPVAIQRPDMSEVLTELKECLGLVLTRARNQRMTTKCGTPSMPHNAFHLELDSEIAPVAR